jgi:hypothetical protein
LATHVVIPDTQVKPGVDTAHLDWIGRYIVEKFSDRPDVKIVHLGDHWDMPSLSSYDKKGGTKMEGRRYVQDIKAGNVAFTLLNKALDQFNYGRRRRGQDEWLPERHLLLGNHEYRIQRAADADAQLDGLLSLDSLETRGWDVHPFLEPVLLDGVAYAHYFYNPMTGNPFSGSIENRLKHVGHSFTMGHQQTLLYGVRPVFGRLQQGVVAGSCYIHDEDYKGPQGNTHWRGIIVKNEVSDGQYDPMFVSLNFLCQKYEGVSLAEYVRTTTKGAR